MMCWTISIVNCIVLHVLVERNWDIMSSGPCLMYIAVTLFSTKARKKNEHFGINWGVLYVFYAVFLKPGNPDLMVWAFKHSWNTKWSECLNSGFVSVLDNRSLTITSIRAEWWLIFGCLSPQYWWRWLLGRQRSWPCWLVSS